MYFLFKINTKSITITMVTMYALVVVLLFYYPTTTCVVCEANLGRGGNCLLSLSMQS